MKEIVKRLLESREATLPTKIFDLKPHSSDLYDILDDLEYKIMSIAQMQGEGINLDDSGFDGDPEIRPDRTITFKAQIFRFDAKNRREVPLKGKEISAIEHAILEKIVLPEEDDKYEYEVTASIEDTDLKVKLRREQKSGW